MRRNISLSLLFMVLVADAPARAQNVINAGDPALHIWAEADIDDYTGTETGLAITSAGVMFTVIESGISSGQTHLDILRSGDHGRNWSLWSTVDELVPGDALSISSSSLVVVAGPTNEWLLLACLQHDSPQSVWVGRTNALAAAASWSWEQVEALPPDVAGYPDVSAPVLAARPTVVGAATAAVAYVVETAAFDFETRYSVSLNAANTFAPPVTVLDYAPPVDGSESQEVALGFSSGDQVNLALLRHRLSTPANFTRINYVSAGNNGVNLADWNLPVTRVHDDPSGSSARGLSLASDPLGNDMVVGVSHWTTPIILVFGSLDGGLTWLPGTIDNPETFGSLKLTWTALGPLGVAHDWTSGYHVLRPDSGPLGTYEAALFMRDPTDNSGFSFFRDAHLVTDPTQGGQYAMAALMRSPDDNRQRLWFNAAWRDDVGYGLLDIDRYDHLVYGFSSPRFVAPPAVVDLDGDGQAEVLAVSDHPYLWGYFGDGTSVTFDLGNDVMAGPSSLPAVYDLDGDGDLEVLVGNADGTISACDHQLTALAGQPFDLGSGTAVHVSIGPVTGHSVADIVATSGDGIHLLGIAGEERPGWPLWLGGVAVAGRAAIGDVDGDGEVEIAAAITTGVLIVDGAGGVENLLATGGVPPSAGVTLLDLDDDGDLEIAVPLSDGTVRLLHHDGTPWSAAWPHDTGTASPILGVSVAMVATATAPALCFATASGSVHAVDIAGVPLPGWPKLVAPGDLVRGEPIIDRMAEPGLDQPEIAVATEGGWYHQWTVAGTQPADWPHFHEESAWGPVVADVDGDAIQEIVMVAGLSVYIVDTGVPPLAGEGRRWPMAGHDLARTGCADCPVLTPVAVPGDGPAAGPRVSFAGAAPNPSPGRATFSFSLGEPDRAELVVYDVRGRRVRRLGADDWPAGDHRLNWDGRDDTGAAAASGLYLARLTVGAGPVKRVLTRELVLQR